MELDRDNYKLLLNDMPEAFILFQVVTDKDGSPVDYLIHDLNTVFETISGLSKNEIIGEKVSVLSAKTPCKGFDWLEICNMLPKAVKSPQQFEYYNENKIRWYEVSAWSFQADFLAVIFRDITTIKKEESLLHRNELRFRSLVETMKGGLVVEDERRNIILTNQAFCDIFSIPAPPEALMGSNCAEAAEEVKHLLNKPEIFPRRIAEIIENQEVIIGEEIYFADGRVFERDYIPVFSHVKTFIGHMWQYRDITERKEAEEKLRESEEQYRDLVNNAGDFVQCVDSTGKFVFVNQSWLSTLGYSLKELDSLTLWDIIHPDSLEHCMAAFQKVLEGKAFGDVEAIFVAKNGDRIIVEGNVNVKLDDEGNFVHTRGIFRDVTERKRAEEALRDREEKHRMLYSMLRIMSDTMPDMLWAKDLDRKYIFANKAICKNLLNANDTSEPIGKNDLYFANREREAHPEQPDWHTFGELCMDSDAVTLKEMKPMQFDEYGNVKGKFLYLDVHKAPLYNEEGELIGVVGTARDVTEQKKNEEALRNSEQRAKRQRSAIAKLVLDENIIKEEIYSALNRITAVTANTIGVERSSIWTLDESGEELRCISSYEAKKGTHSSGAVLQAKEMPRYFAAIREESRINTENAQEDPRTSELTEYYLKPLGITSILDAGIVIDGQLKGVICFEHAGNPRVWQADEEAFASTVASIVTQLFFASERKKAEDRILHMSYHDQLTGLYNRYYLEEDLKKPDNAEKLPLSIIMADINGLKLINDTYGYNKGDQVLKRTAAVLKKTCRVEDVVARFGSDEFVILLPRTPEKEALAIGKRITHAFRKVEVDDVPLTISTGVAVKTGMEQDTTAVLREAENNLNQNKLTESRSGKSAVLDALLKTLAEKSYETEAHTRNMQEVALAIGEKLGLPESELHRLNLLIILHDIGKINLPEELLTKKGALTDHEWEIMKKHPETGYRIAQATEAFAHVAEDILAHHEHWDGSGYPRGLQREAIPLLARITAVADAYEVMLNGRPYKKAMTLEAIINELKACSGSQFDPQLVEIFLEIIENHGRS